jgi:hypothetical protein
LRPHSADLRALLNDAFSDEELTTLCFDHFRAVYDNFSAGMSKSQKIQRLLEHCFRRHEVQALVILVERANPAQYRRYQASWLAD